MEKRLNTLDRIRKFTGGVLRELHAGKIETDRARAIFYGASILGQLVKDADLVTRMDALERQMEERTNGDFGKAT